jgi:hypothetical protein
MEKRYRRNRPGTAVILGRVFQGISWPAVRFLLIADSAIVLYMNGEVFFFFFLEKESKKKKKRGVHRALCTLNFLNHFINYYIVICNS